MENQTKKEAENYFDDFGTACSATDCTGLIPALPSCEAELEAYEEMYRFCAKTQKSHAHL
ncbi:MAG TPA: hypothetical protein IAB84_09035 [Candidatus Choladousia intestinigallinarum]|nr:hypothetical protein [Candidatus Choladousia intestinigallinarum]